MLIQAHSPLLLEEGWLRDQENNAKPPLTAQTGWSVTMCRSSLSHEWLRESSPVPIPRFRGECDFQIEGSASLPSRDTASARTRTLPSVSRSAVSRPARRLSRIPHNKNRQCTDQRYIADGISCREAGVSEDTSRVRLPAQFVHCASICPYPFFSGCCKCCEVGCPCGGANCKCGSCLTTPSAPSKVASRHLLDGAATPPLRGGDYEAFFDIQSSLNLQSLLNIHFSGSPQIPS
jgi:hypothetical protein